MKRIDRSVAMRSRRDFVQSIAAFAVVPTLQQASQQVVDRRVTAADPGVSWLLTETERTEAARVLNRALTPYMGGDWVGVRQGRDSGADSASVRRYLPYLGGPQVVGEVQAVATDGTITFLAAKHMVYSPARKTLVTYFFEIGADVQIFELDLKSIETGRLLWNEILRTGPLFRVEETLPKDDEFKITVWRQNDAGTYEVWATETLERRWKAAYRRRK